MALNLELLDAASRMLISARLVVSAGTGGRFQPTGFPDLGPALYKGFADLPSTRRAETPAATVDMLLVESVQSIANRLEDACLAGEDYNADCQGIPYVRILDGHRSNAFLTSSVREPHRLASPYVLGAKANGVVYRDELKTALAANKQRPVHTWKIARELFRRDPGCVLHGVFLEEIDGRIRLPRLVSGYIEAAAPNQANSGGVYRGEVTAKDNIPYARQEFTSGEIVASFIVHLATLRSYGLDDDERHFLQLWALYKIDRFLYGSLRLRTACEFEVSQINVTVDGQSRNLSAQAASDEETTDGRWPGIDEIGPAFADAKERCFPMVRQGDDWVRRNVRSLTYAVDIAAQSELPQGVDPAAVNLAGFVDRAKVKSVTTGKGAKKRTFNALILNGEWPEEDQVTLLFQNPETKAGDDGEEIPNPAHPVVKVAIKKWKDAWTKQQKKATGTDEDEE